MPDSPATRAAFLRDRVEARREQGGPTSDVPFRQKVHDLHRIQVPIDFPLYNLQSGRSHRAQSRYIEENGLPEDYFADPETLARIEGEGRVAFRYCDATGAITVEANRNGSLNAIAGVLSETGNVLGMMPHPENFVEDLIGGTDGRGLFDSLAA